MAERILAVDFVPSLKAEIDALEASLRDDPDPRIVKLQELRRVLLLYTGISQPAGPTGSVAPSMGTYRQGIGAPVGPAPPPRERPGRKMAPERQQAIEETVKILKQTKGPMKTGELYDLISKMGIKLGGTDPQNNYSSLLYGRDEFRIAWSRRLDAQTHARTIDAKHHGQSARKARQLLGILPVFIPARSPEMETPELRTPGRFNKGTYKGDNAMWHIVVRRV